MTSDFHISEPRHDQVKPGPTDCELLDQFFAAVGCTKPTIEHVMSGFGLIFDAQYFLDCANEPNQFASVGTLLHRARQLGWDGDPRDWRRFLKPQPDPTPAEN